MASSRMLRRVAIVRTDVSEKHSASIIRATRLDELGTTLPVNSNRRTLFVALPSWPVGPLAHDISATGYGQLCSPTFRQYSVTYFAMLLSPFRQIRGYKLV
jgi:hypothetical protein